MLYLRRNTETKTEGQNNSNQSDIRLSYRGDMNRYFQKLFYQANAESYSQKRSLFYPLKHRLLQRYGTPDGWDRQEIVKICYTCDGTGVYVNGWGICDECWHCNNGIYSQKLIRLSRYRLGDRVYHVPCLQAPDKHDTTYNNIIIGIIGTIQHNERFVVDGWAACQILLLRYAPFALLNYWLSQWSFWVRRQKYSIAKKVKRLFQEEVDEPPF